MPVFSGLMFVTEQIVKTGKIHIGTSGWSYSDWKGEIYPKELKSTDWLMKYAEWFDTTEINSSFYRMPREQTVINWAAKVPDGFKICPKISKYLTHTKRLKEPEEPLQRFFSVFGQIKSKLGPVLVQLPPSLKFDEEIAQHFFGLLKSEYKQYHFVLEVRHSTWLEQEAVDLLHQYKIGTVISQSGVGFPYTEEITSHIVYVRFHGPAKLYDSSYSDEQLQEYAVKFKKWIKEGKEVWVFFNNTMRGHGFYNARTLQEMMK